MTVGTHKKNIQIQIQKQNNQPTNQPPHPNQPTNQPPNQQTPGGAVKYEVDTGVRPALQQAGAFGESTGSKNEGSLGESMIFGIQ